MAVAAATASPRPTGRLLRRRRVDRLSARQLAALRQAFGAVQSSTGERGSAFWADLQARGGQHHTGLFLPWQRAYLYAFERALQDHVAGVSLPWWDWAARPAVPEAFSTPKTPEGPNPLLEGQVAVEDSRPTRRAPGAGVAPPQPAEVRALMAIEDFGSFAERLEAVHDAVHVWVGGDMAQIRYAAYDPLFWPLTAMVDQIWWSWQLRHPDSQPHPELLEAPLEPFGMRVRDVLDASALGYKYDVRRPSAPKTGEPEPADEPWRPTLAGYVSDAVPELPIDHLNVQDDVEALCAVVASREVTPPLSIGLFGDWGAGKSTFMGLMRDRIEELAERTRAADGRSVFIGDVQQITFNAWHYADDNLWASLVTHIFEELGVPTHYEAGDHAQPAPNGVLGRIAAARSAAEQTIDDADTQEATARSTIEQLPATPARALAHAAMRSADAPPLPEDAVVKETRAEVLDAFGAPAAEALDDVVQSTNTLTRLLRRIHAWRELVRGGGRARRRALLSAGILAVGLIGIVVLPLLGVGLGSIAAAAAAVGGVASVLNQLMSAEQTVSSAVDRIEEHVDDERRQAEQSIADAEAAKTCAAQEIASIESGAFVRQYFAKRAAAAEYRSQLGIISTVRRDFADLRIWLRTARAMPAEDRAGVPSVDRVVLYIDDLDRCPTRRVIEVLEAVHLLLALDLFVVVVAVDPRWLLSSLERHYAAQFARRKDADGAHASWATTPEHYLEKIFQIPFNLRPMDRTGFTELVTSMLPLRNDPATAAPAGTGPGPQDPVDSGSSFVPGGPPPSPDATPDAPQDDDELQPAGLSVEPGELEFLSELSGLVPTPRATKRLINTYRLIRAPLDPTTLQALIDEQHRVVLLLLALLVGCPSVTPRLFGGLLAEPPETSWPEFVERLHAAGNGAPDWTRAAIELSEVTAATDLPATVEPFRAWVPILARYSFETARLAPTPI
jgi:hypothetical protein